MSPKKDDQFGCRKSSRSQPGNSDAHLRAHPWMATPAAGDHPSESIYTVATTNVTSLSHQQSNYPHRLVSREVDFASQESRYVDPRAVCAYYNNTFLPCPHQALDPDGEALLPRHLPYDQGFSSLSECSSLNQSSYIKQELDDVGPWSPSWLKNTAISSISKSVNIFRGSRTSLTPSPRKRTRKKQKRTQALRTAPSSSALEGSNYVFRDVYDRSSSVESVVSQAESNSAADKSMFDADNHAQSKILADAPCTPKTGSIPHECPAAPARGLLSNESEPLRLKTPINCQSRESSLTHDENAAAAAASRSQSITSLNAVSHIEVNSRASTGGNETVLSHFDVVSIGQEANRMKVNTPPPSDMNTQSRQQNSKAGHSESISVPFARTLQESSDTTALPYGCEAAQESLSALYSDRGRPLRKTTFYADYSQNPGRSMPLHEERSNSVGVANKALSSACKKWTNEDYALMLRMRSQGTTWDSISNALGRSSRACQLKYKQIQTVEVPESAVLEHSDARLLHVYDRYKKRMWSEMAAELNCLASTVEQRVMRILRVSGE